MKNLSEIKISFQPENLKSKIIESAFYQIFGQPIGEAPVVVVNHALTGNSNVAGENGWWNNLIGDDKIIDTNYFTVIAINIPGNGFDGNPENLISYYKGITIRDIAGIFWKTLDLLHVDSVFAIIGGSLGGAIAWEMAVLNPKKIQHLIPVATDWKATDWVIANVLVQDQILNNSDDPIADARLHAMLLYRTPQSLRNRFGRSQSENFGFQIENWLLGHGIKLKNRFRLPAYKLMNHLLKTNDITRTRGNLEEIIPHISAEIHLVAVDTDYFFTADETRETYNRIQSIKPNIFYHEIKSIHGHDAFLIEYEQLSKIVNPIFNTIKLEQPCQNTL